MGQNKRKSKPAKSPLSHDNQLIRMALHIAKLEAKARALRKELKEVTRELKFKRRELKGYAQSLTEAPLDGQQSPPMRIFGER